MSLTHNNLDMEGRHLHPEARNWLACLNKPSISLEQMTLAQLTGQLAKDGYMPIDPGSVTIGWGRKAQDNDACTSCTFVTSDRSLVTLGMGSEGAYWLEVLAQDIARPTEAEQEELRRKYEAFLSGKFGQQGIKTQSGDVITSGMERISVRALGALEAPCRSHVVDAVRNAFRHSHKNKMRAGR